LISNLQLLSRIENNRKSIRSRNNKTGYIGVFIRKCNANRIYATEITVNYKRFALGCFETPERAARIYDRATIQRALHNIVDVKRCQKKTKFKFSKKELRLVKKLVPDHVLNFELSRYVEGI
jgi:uncharacterized protein YqiB (DUF1249 family)